MTENLKKTVMYDVLNDIMDNTHTNSDLIRSMYSLADRLTDGDIDLEGERSKEEYDLLYDSLYKELSKLA